MGQTCVSSGKIRICTLAETLAPNFCGITPTGLVPIDGQMDPQSSQHEQSSDPDSPGCDVESWCRLMCDSCTLPTTGSWSGACPTSVAQNATGLAIDEKEKANSSKQISRSPARIMNQTVDLRSHQDKSF